MSAAGHRLAAAQVRAAALALVLLLAGCAAPQADRPGRPPAPRPSGGPAPDTPVKIGKPYQIAGIWYYPADDGDYDEVGLASWYGAQFHGARTANGEQFDMDRVGAAHKTLPLPSYVEVTALDTGRTIVVRINDRGPFVANRIIDLSRRSAQLLGIERAGVSRVRVRRVYPSDEDRLALRSGRPASERRYASASELAALNQRFVSRPATPKVPARVAAAVPDEAVPVGGWFVQVTALSSRPRAEEIAELLGARVEPVGALWRVRLGPYPAEKDASNALAQVRSRGYQESRLVRIETADGATAEGFPRR